MCFFLFFLADEPESTLQNPKSNLQIPRFKIETSPKSRPEIKRPLEPFFDPQKIKQSFSVFLIGFPIPSQNALDRPQKNVPTRSHDFANSLWHHRNIDKTRDSTPLEVEGIKIPNPRSTKLQDPKSRLQNPKSKTHKNSTSKIQISKMQTP